VDEHARARKEEMRSGTPKARATHVRVHASVSGRDHGCAPMKDLKSRIVTFSLAIVVSLAAWGGFVYLAMHFLKK
jgi:hypothetical protein